MNVPTYFTVAEGHLYAGVSESTFRWWIKEAGLPHIRAGRRGGKILVAREDLDQWLASLKITNRKGPKPVKAPAPKTTFKHLKV